MVSGTQALPTLFIYHPCHIDLMVTESLLSSCLLKQFQPTRRRQGREMTCPIPLREHSRRPSDSFNPQLEFSPRPHLTAMETGEGKLQNHWDQRGPFHYFLSMKIYKTELLQLPESVSRVSIEQDSQSSQEDSHSSELSQFFSILSLSPSLYIITHILRGPGWRHPESEEAFPFSLMMSTLLSGEKKKKLLG